MLIVLCGIPASGKTSFTHWGFEKDVKVISTDKIRGELFGDESIQRNPRLVFDTAYNRIANALQKNENVIFDATNLTIKDRKEIFKRFSPNVHEIIAVYFNTPLEVCLERNAKRERKVPEDVIRRMHDRIQEPTTEEGFSLTYKVYPNNQYFK